MMSPRSLVYALCFAFVVSAARVDVQKRDAPFVPQRVNIPLSFDSQGRYVASVTMGSGQQHFNFTMTTSTALTYVAGTHCSSCSGVNLYDQSKSTTAQDFSTANSVSLLGQPASAAVIKEDCQLRTAGGSGWDYPNQTIVVVNQPAQGQLAQASNAQVGNALAGLIGLATNKNPSSSTNSSEYQPQFGDSIGGQWLNNHPTAVNFTFGMALGTPLLRARGNTSTSKTLDTSAGDPGTLHWLQPDDSAYDPAQVQWKEAGTLAGATSSNTTGDWYVSLDGWVLVSGDNHISNSKSVVATVDPMFTDMYLPQDQAKLIHDAIPGSALRPDLSSLGGLSQAWTIPCNASFSYGLVIGSQTFTLSESTLVLQQPDGTCVSGIEAWTDPSQTEYAFGARFLSTIYLIFNIPRDGPNTMGFAPRTLVVKKTSHVGAIVGGTIGGVAFLVFVGFAVFFFFYRHRQRAYRVTAAQYDAQEIEKPTDGTVNPFPLSAATTTPTTVQFAHAAPSTVGSDTLSSPSTVPMLAHHRFDDDSLDVAPPSYDASEADRRPSGQQQRAGPSSAREEKALLSARLNPGNNARVPPSPVENDAGASGSASATVYE